jgi:hypothetical protein
LLKLKALIEGRLATFSPEEVVTTADDNIPAEENKASAEAEMNNKEETSAEAEVEAEADVEMSG